MVLRDITDLVHSMGNDIKSCGIPDLDHDDDCSSGHSREVQEFSVTMDKDHLSMAATTHFSSVLEMSSVDNLY
jgi:hypothetical protein